MTTPRKWTPWFASFAKHIDRAACHPAAFFGAFLVVVLWMLLGPFAHFSDTWQLAINTSTSIVTFLMVFLIQNAHRRGSDAMQSKLDELIRAVAGARNSVMKLEDLDEEGFARVRDGHTKLAAEARGEPLLAGKRTV
jgi:low affinity Fe/Cu permease